MALFLLYSCSFTGSFSLNDLNFGGDEVGNKIANNVTVKTDYKKIQQRWDIESKKEIIVTKEMVRAYKDGKLKARQFMTKHELSGQVNLKNDLTELDPELMKRNPKLETCSSDIIKIANLTWKILAPARFLVIECHRSKERQAQLKAKGNSQNLSLIHI